MPAELVGSGENVAGGFIGRGRPMHQAAGGPWEITSQQDIGASTNQDPRLQVNHSSDPRCECIGPSDPRTEIH
jgi:hypothetical protein